MSFLDRYVAGEHTKVWSELCTMGPAVKVFVSGVGGVMTPVPCPNADAELWFEGGPLLANGKPWLLVPYLREAILVRGGIGPFGMAKRRPALTKDLPLLPF